MYRTTVGEQPGTKTKFFQFLTFIFSNAF